ncbi:MAG TPA: PEP-CTERM sorting domain-containing protein [Thermoguttaceae bacterium]|nr:PEP-CTERM sorting domain-containing protein [Thermoguttaceae bacterium]
MSPRSVWGTLLRPLLLLVVGAALFAAAPAQAGITYNFENLSTGALVGQDNWIHFAGGTGHQVILDTPSHLGGQQTNVVTGFEQSARTNNANFSFNTYGPYDSLVVMEFDVLPSTDDTATFALGKDLAAGTTGRLGPQLGIWVYSGYGFIIRGAKQGTIYPASLGPNDESTDWYRVRLVANVAANGGNGAGTLLVKNLTDGETTWRQVLTDKNLELLTMDSGAQHPSTWNSLYIRSGGAGTKFDNLVANTITGTTIYAEFFPNNTGTSQPLSTVAWRQHMGNDGSETPVGNMAHVAAWASIPNVTAVNSNPANSSQNGYTYGEGISGQPMIVWTEEYALPPAHRPTAARWYTWYPANDPLTLKLAVRIEGMGWYVTEQDASWVADGADPGWRLLELDLTTAAWKQLNFVPGSVLGVGASVPALPLGRVTAFGVFEDSYAQAVRIDNFVLYSVVPEPTSLVLLAAGAVGFLWLAWRRKVRVG